VVCVVLGVVYVVHRKKKSRTPAHTGPGCFFPPRNTPELTGLELRVSTVVVKVSIILSSLLLCTDLHRLARLPVRR
jgi:hypothetical protein